MSSTANFDDFLQQAETTTCLLVGSLPCVFVVRYLLSVALTIHDHPQTRREDHLAESGLLLSETCFQQPRGSFATPFTIRSLSVSIP